MSFWNKNKLSNNTKQEYSSLLIELVELNEDKQWLEYFHNLRLGHDLPGGGMGSLNDWSPNYKNDVEYAWFNLLYKITHKLFTEKKETEFIKNDFSILHRDEVNILKCSNCDQKFQHPRIFEDHIATFYYYKNFSKFVKQNKLKSFTNPNNSFNNIEAKQLRESLECEYKKKNIILFDFLKHERICPKCETKMEIEHLDFILTEKENKFELNKKKLSAD